MTRFKELVINIVCMIPQGNVMSYGQVALYTGVPRAARQVGFILNQMEEKILVPWWRVVNNKGRISIKGSQYSSEEQKQLLLQEGVDVKPDLTFDIEKYRFIPDKSYINQLGLDASYLNKLLMQIPLTKTHFK